MSLNKPNKRFALSQAECMVRQLDKGVSGELEQTEQEVCPVAGRMCGATVG